MNYNFLSETQLFYGCTPKEIECMLKCLGAYVKKYDKAQAVYNIGETVECIGMVLDGGVSIEIDDVWGNKNIISNITVGQIFAETYALIQAQPLMVSAVCTQPTQVLFLNTSKLLQTCTASCPHHHRLIQNLLQASAKKNLSLSRRILHTSSKSIRARVLSYLSECVMLNNSYRFDIPFNRQQLADYLSVDRSALSNELSKMQKEGILTVRKNSFCIKQHAAVQGE